MDVLVPHLFSVHCNTSLPFPFKNSVLRRLLLFSLCGDTMGRSASAMKVRGASQPAFQKVRMKICGAALPVAKAKAKAKQCSKPRCRNNAASSRAWIWLRAGFGGSEEDALRKDANADPRNGSDPVSSGSGASQPTSSAGSCSQSATVSTTDESRKKDIASAWKRLKKFGRFPNRIMNPQTEAEQEEADLWMYLYHQKSLGMPDEVWNRLRRYGDTRAWNMQVAVDAREAVIADVEAFVKKFRRLPQRFVDRKPACSEEANLARRLQRSKKRFDDDQQVRLIAFEEQCHAAIQDGKRVAWRMLLDDVSQFVRDSRRWPTSDLRSTERLRKFDNPNRSYFKEELLAERLAKTTKEFDEAHLTELRNLQKDAEQRAVEDLVREVTELGYWLHAQFNKLRPSNRVCRA